VALDRVYLVMGVVNRCAISVQALEPLKQWLEQLDPEAQAVFGHPPTLYLIPEYGCDEEGEELLEDCFEWIFESELSSWSEDRSTWPQQRDFALFRQWFAVNLHPMVVDLVDDVELRNGPTEEEKVMLASVKRQIQQLDAGRGFAG